MIGDVNSSRFGLVESRSSLKVLKAHKMGISNPISSDEEVSGLLPLTWYYHKILPTHILGK